MEKRPDLNAVHLTYDAYVDYYKQLELNTHVAKIYMDKLLLAQEFLMSGKSDE